MLAIAPVSRTPMDKAGGRSLSKYIKSLEKNLDNSVPWQRRASGRGAHLHRNLKPGEMIVVLDEGDTSDLPVFKGVKTTRE